MRGGHAGARVHAHVERPVEAEAEAAGRVVELEGRDAEVEDDDVCRRHAVRVDDGLEVGEITLGDLDGAAGAKTGATGVDSALIAIDRDHPAARGDALEERGRDPAGAKGGVDGDLPGPGLQALYEGCEKDRPVARAVKRRGTGRGIDERPHAGHERQGDGHVTRPDPSGALTPETEMRTCRAGGPGPRPG